MNFITVILVAFGLAMDAFAVSISCGISDDKHSIKNGVKAGVAFGLFQGGMTAIGWGLGFSFKEFIEPVDHWVAFGLLLFIGLKLIKEAREASCTPIPLTSLKMILTLSIATSIDALAAGISISTLDSSILVPSVTIGIITMILSFIGVQLGCKIGCNTKFKASVDILGGMILIFIGTKILIEHLMS